VRTARAGPLAMASWNHPTGRQAVAIRGWTPGAGARGRKFHL